MCVYLPDLPELPPLLLLPRSLLPLLTRAGPNIMAGNTDISYSLQGMELHCFSCHLSFTMYSCLSAHLRLRWPLFFSCLPPPTHPKYIFVLRRCLCPLAKDLSECRAESEIFYLLYEWLAVPVIVILLYSLLRRAHHSAAEAPEDLSHAAGAAKPTQGEG